jgi:hypothetical protein
MNCFSVKLIKVLREKQADICNRFCGSFKNDKIDNISSHIRNKADIKECSQLTVSHAACNSLQDA